MSSASVPRVHIQWKGTDACFDWDCECGSMPHYDGFYAYAIQCPDCGRRYDVPMEISLREFSGAFIPVVTENDAGATWR